MILPLGLSSLGTILTYATALFGAFIAALWVSLIFWTYRDIRLRSPDRFVHILAAVLVALLNLPGVVVYLVLRPAHTLAESYQHTLEEEALLTQIENRTTCPGCGIPTERTWQICPNCHTRLRKRCAHCSELMDLPWQICPHCARPAPGVRAEFLETESNDGGA